ncbi:MuF-like minor capsid protein [Gordonia phage WhoseManz]|nr:MuF-like minor capsid protein [Gordonia phage WhoseManz]
MTTPGSLAPRPSLLDVPAVPPEEMTAEEQEQWTVAQVAAITLAAASAREQVATNTTLALVPLLRLINPYNEEAVTRFAKEAAQLVTAGIDQVGQVAWAAVSSRLSVQGYTLSTRYQPPTDGRTTDLEVAYKRVAADYRRRVAAGPDSIRGTIAQAEEERFQAIGGAVVAEGRRGESNAEIEGTKRTPAKGAGSSGSSDRAKGSSKAAGGGGSERTGESDPKPRPTPSDRAVNDTREDRDGAAAAGELPSGASAADAAAEDAARAEAELRREAALSDAEKQRLLEQVAQQEMEVRLERMVNDDLSMANRSAFRNAINAAPKGVITGYRRVLHPELSQSGQSCGLCVAASTRIYKKKDLLPIHNLCNCEPIEIVKGRDVGQQINDEDLDTLYGEAGFSTHRTDLSNTKYTVFNHPELGPVLRSVPRSKKRKPVDIQFSPRESSTDRGGQQQ